MTLTIDNSTTNLMRQLQLYVSEVKQVALQAVFWGALARNPTSLINLVQLTSAVKGAHLFVRTIQLHVWGIAQRISLQTTSNPEESGEQASIQASRGLQIREWLQAVDAAESVARVKLDEVLHLFLDAFPAVNPPIAD